jgi:hypothetical protein
VFLEFFYFSILCFTFSAIESASNSLSLLSF